MVSGVRDCDSEPHHRCTVNYVVSFARGFVRFDKAAVWGETSRIHHPLKKWWDDGGGSAHRAGNERESLRGSESQRWQWAGGCKQMWELFHSFLGFSKQFSVTDTDGVWLLSLAWMKFHSQTLYSAIFETVTSITIAPYDSSFTSYLGLKLMSVWFISSFFFWSHFF